MAKINPRKLETWEPKVGQGIQSFISGIDFLKGDSSRQSEVIGQAKRILSGRNFFLTALRDLTKPCIIVAL